MEEKTTYEVVKRCIDKLRNTHYSGGGEYYFRLPVPGGTKEYFCDMGTACRDAMRLWEEYAQSKREET